MSQLDYSNQNLQNCSFKRKNLAGANFSGSDLRGCNFTGATLLDANFEGVKTGQSPRQKVTYLAAALVGPVVLVGLSVIGWQFVDFLLPDGANSGLNFILNAFLILVLLLGSLLRDWITIHFPQLATLLSITAIAILLIMMVILTVGLVIVSFSNFWDGALLLGVALLLIAGVAGVITFRIFTWLLQALESSPGTSFRKADLTDANFSHATVQNTDFSQSVLTGVCLFNWVVRSHLQFSQVYCEYIYLASAHQNRYPSEGNLQPGELERLLFHPHIQ